MFKSMKVETAVRRLKKIGTDTAREVAGWMQEERFENATVHWYEGAVETDEPFLVPEIVVVNGDLKTSQTLFDCEKADESLLGVLGNVTVDNLISFGNIIIEKDLTATGLVYGDSLCDLFLDVKGMITAPVVLESGHCIEAAEIRADIVLSASNRIEAKKNPDLHVFDVDVNHPVLHKLLAETVFDAAGDIDRILVNKEAKRSGRILVSTEERHLVEAVGLLTDTLQIEEEADKTVTATQPGSELESLLSQAKDKLAAGDAQAVYELNLTAFQHMQQGDFLSAVGIFEVLISHEVKDLSVYCNALYAVQHDNSGLGVDPARHRRFLEACLPYASANPSILTNAACVYVELGEPDKVFEMLETSLGFGHTEFLSFEDEPMFQVLLEEARFQRLFAQAKNTDETGADDETDAENEPDSLEIKAEILKELEASGNRFSLYDLVDFPEACPWYNGETEIKLFLKTLYQPFQKDLAGLIKFLIDNCKAVYSLELGTNWWLIYDLGHEDECLVGGAPNTAPKLSSEAEALGWRIPTALRKFARLHDGFGYTEAYNIAGLNDRLPEWEFVLPVQRLMTPSEFWSEDYFRELCQQQLENWEGCTPDEWEECHLEDFLFFLVIGTGDGVGFVRSSKNDADYKTVTWWHDDAQGSPVSFFEFLEERFVDASTDEDEEDAEAREAGERDWNLPPLLIPDDGIDSPLFDELKADEVLEITMTLGESWDEEKYAAFNEIMMPWADDTLWAEMGAPDSPVFMNEPGQDSYLLRIQGVPRPRPAIQALLGALSKSNLPIDEFVFSLRAVDSEGVLSAHLPDPRMPEECAATNEEAWWTASFDYLAAQPLSEDEQGMFAVLRMEDDTFITESRPARLYFPGVRVIYHVGNVDALSSDDRTAEVSRTVIECLKKRFGGASPHVFNQDGERNGLLDTIVKEERRGYGFAIRLQGMMRFTPGTFRYREYELMSGLVKAVEALDLEPVIHWSRGEVFIINLWEKKENAGFWKPTCKTWEQPPQKQEAEAEVRRFFDCLKSGDLSGAKASVAHKFNDWDSQIWSLWRDTYLIYLEEQDEEVEDDSLEGNAWRDDLSWLAGLEVERIHWDTVGDRVSEGGEHLVVQLRYKGRVVDVSGDFAVEKGAAGYCVIREIIHGE